MPVRINWGALKDPDALAFWSVRRPRGEAFSKLPEAEKHCFTVHPLSMAWVFCFFFFSLHISIIHPIKAHKTQIKWFPLAREWVFGKQC